MLSHHRFRRPLRLPILGIAVALALAPVGRPAAGQTPAGVLVIGSEGVIPPLDPHRMTGTVGLRVVDAVFDPLVREDLTKPTTAAPDITPALAESWTVSADGKTYTFRVREGVTFHDGIRLDAPAVQRNFERLMDRSSPLFDAKASGNMAFLTAWIASTAAPDGRTFVMRLKAPFAGVLRLLTDRRMSIASPKALEQFKGDALSAHPVGTGPYVLDAYAPGRPLELTRNARYWGRAPKVERIVFRPFTDPTSLAIAMQTGEVDVIPSASAQQVEQLKGRAGIAVQYPEPPNQYFLRLNMRAAPTNDAGFRRALNYAVNRDAIAALFGGQAAPLYGPVPRGNEIFGERLAATYAYDPGKARALIAAAGIATPVTIRFLAPSSGPGFGLAAQVVSLIQQDLKAVGVNLEPRFLEFSTLIATERGGYTDDVNGSYNGWVTGADGAHWLERMFGGEQQPPKGVNRGWYQSPEADALFEKARGEADDSRRKALYRQAAETIARDAPWVFLYQDRLPRLFRDRVTGIVPAGSVYLDYVSIALR